MPGKHQQQTSEDSLIPPVIHQETQENRLLLLDIWAVMENVCKW